MAEEEQLRVNGGPGPTAISGLVQLLFDCEARGSTTPSSDPRSSPQPTESKGILPALPRAPRRDCGARVVAQPSAKRLIRMVTRRPWPVTTLHRRKPPHAKCFTFVDFHGDGAIATPVVMPRHSRATAHNRSIGLFSPSAPRFIRCECWGFVSVKNQTPSDLQRIAERATSPSVCRSEHRLTARSSLYMLRMHIETTP